MMTPPERSVERDAAIDALLAQEPAVGWTMGALRGVLRGAAAPEDAEMVDDDADMLFPGGTPDLIEACIDLADRRMEAAAEAADMSALRLPGRVRAVIALRLAQHAVRRAVAVLALPVNAPLASRCTARTVDAIWYAAGDRAADFSWYTKRAILTAMYGATLLFWLRDTSENDSATLAFLDRRLASVGRVGAARKRAEALIARLRPGSAAA
jgi:ubiquinone biosynthesis protein COQ9